MVVFTPLLDGPQLSSRWAARYASVLADDPGSTVLTLTSFGMAERSRPNGHNSSPVIALWKNPGRGTREIPLEAGAQGVLLSASADRTPRRSSDGRRPVVNGGEFFDMSVHQVRAATAGSGPAEPPLSDTTERPGLEADDLTILTSWAQAVAEVLTVSPERVEAVLADAHASALWRTPLGLPEPSPQFSRAIDTIDHAVGAASLAAGMPTAETVLTGIADGGSGQQSPDWLAHRVLQAALEQRLARTALCDDLHSYPSPTL
jgi:hypothetical protein